MFPSLLYPRFKILALRFPYMRVDKELKRQVRYFNFLPLDFIIHTTSCAYARNVAFTYFFIMIIHNATIYFYSIKCFVNDKQLLLHYYPLIWPCQQREVTMHVVLSKWIIMLMTNASELSFMDTYVLLWIHIILQGT